MPKGVTAGVLRLLKYDSTTQVEFLANLCGREEGYDDKVFLLEARRRTQKVVRDGARGRQGV